MVNSTGVTANNSHKITWDLEDNTIGAVISPIKETSEGKASATITATGQGFTTVVVTVTDRLNPNQQETLRTRAYFINKAHMNKLKISNTRHIGKQQVITLTTHIQNEEAQSLNGHPVVWSIEDNHSAQANFIGLPSNNISYTNNQGFAEIKVAALNSGKPSILATLPGQSADDSKLIRQQSLSLHFNPGAQQLTITPDTSQPIEADNKKYATITAQLTSSEPENIIGRRIVWVLKKNEANAQWLEPLKNNETLTDIQRQSNSPAQSKRRRSCNSHSLSHARGRHQFG